MLYSRRVELWRFEARSKTHIDNRKKHHVRSLSLFQHYITLRILNRPFYFKLTLKLPSIGIKSSTDSKRREPNRTPDNCHPMPQIFSIVYTAFFRSIILLVVSLLVVNFLPKQLFEDFKFEPKAREIINYDAVIPKEWNPLLSDQPVEFVGLNQLLGPESLAIAKNGLVYTGLADGRLVELNLGKGFQQRVVLRFKTSPECKDDEPLNPIDCGRFLQVRFSNGTLYAIEASTGLYAIDVKSGSKKFIGPSPHFNKPSLYNSFVFDPVEPNLVYISVSSTRWNLKTIIWSIIEIENSGQLIALDINTGKRAIVQDGLFLANGVDVDAKRDRLILSETTLSQIDAVPLASIRSAFRGAKDGDRIVNSVERTALIPIVPGNPDNIIISGDLAYIALPFVKPNGKELIDVISTMPNIRKAVGRVQYGIGKGLQYILNNLFHHPLLKFFSEELMSGHVNYRIMNPSRSGVLEYNLATGSSRLLGSDNFSFISEAVPDGQGNLLLGSFRSPFIVKTKI